MLDKVRLESGNLKKQIVLGEPEGTKDPGRAVRQGRPGRKCRHPQFGPQTCYRKRPAFLRVPRAPKFARRCSAIGRRRAEGETLRDLREERLRLLPRRGEQEAQPAHSRRSRRALTRGLGGAGGQKNSRNENRQPWRSRVVGRSSVRGNVLDPLPQSGADALLHHRDRVPRRGETAEKIERIK